MRLLVLLIALGACARPARQPPLLGAIRPGIALAYAKGGRQVDERRKAVVEKAREYLSGSPESARGLAFSPDPIGFVRAAYWQAGVDLFDETVARDVAASGMEILYRSVSLHGRLHKELPRPGDLVFFDAAESASALYPAQCAIVEAVAADGTIEVIGRFAQGARRIHLNLRGDPNNDRLAQGSAAALFRSFAEIL